MKKLLQFSTLAVLLSFAVACSNAPEGQKVAAEAAQEATAATAETTYLLNTEQSLINWTGSKPTGQHTGILKMSKGEIGVANGNIVSGDFVFDMMSIKNTDLPAEKQGDLEGHLMAGDFFEVEKFPTGSFQITSVKVNPAGEGATHEITGNLTLKGITKSVTLPANVKMNESMLSAATPAFTINRTEWGINFKSTAIGTLKDQAINDEIGLVMNIIAGVKAVQ